MTYATQAEMIAETRPEEREHFTQCRECFKWWDMRSLDDVAFHCGGHVERADLHVQPGVRVER